MIPKASDLDFGKWKDVSQNYPEWELKIKGTNILIGHAQESFNDNTKLMITCRISNVSGDYIEIPMTTDMNEIHFAWEAVMDKLLEKLFK